MPSFRPSGLQPWAWGKKMRTFGQILLWLGFLAGSLATVFNAPAKGVKFVKGLTPDSKQVKGFELMDLSAVEVPEEGWHLIPWPWYIASAVVCFAGVVVLQISKRSEGQKSEETAANLAEIKSALTRAGENVGKLSNQIGKMAPSKIVEWIDGELAEDIRIFADGRDNITSEFGLSTFADVMSQFAAGERAINRAWSAAADGYVDEAADCVQRANLMFKEASSILNKAKSD